MQRGAGDQDTPSGEWSDYLGIRTMANRLMRADDVQQLQSSSQDSLLVSEDASYCPDATPGTSGRSGSNLPVSQGFGESIEKGVCGFCKKNGETAEIYASHQLKARNGRVRCPVLRKYVCPICGATGDRAHTVQYCPARVLDHTRSDVIGSALNSGVPKK